VLLQRLRQHQNWRGPPPVLSRLPSPTCKPRGPPIPPHTVFFYCSVMLEAIHWEHLIAHPSVVPQFTTTILLSFCQCHPASSPRRSTSKFVQFFFCFFFEAPRPLFFSFFKSGPRPSLCSARGRARRARCATSTRGPRTAASATSSATPASQSRAWCRLQLAPAGKCQVPGWDPRTAASATEFCNTCKPV